MILGVASVWTDEKGLTDYCRLSELIADDEVIALIGVSDEKKNTLPPNIIGISRTESIEELVAWYNLADVVLILSKAETFGMTCAEGMACGTPSIVYDNTALPELITDETGYVVNNGNVNGIYDCIQKIKRKGRDYYSDICREYATNRFDKSKQCKDYVELYNSILK